MNTEHLKLSRTDGRTLRIIEGDITKEAVDAIVNAANEMLAHGGGVAGAIARAGGDTVTDESRRWVEQHGYVPTGKATITRGGNLPAQYVIHAVGPVWDGGTKGEEALLAGAIQSALSLADEHRLKSIAIPAISTGIFGYPKPLAIPTILHAYRSTWTSTPARRWRMSVSATGAPQPSSCSSTSFRSSNEPRSSRSITNPSARSGSRPGVSGALQCPCNDDGNQDQRGRKKSASGG